MLHFPFPLIYRLKKGAIPALGAMLTIALIAGIQNSLQITLLIAPFGATCVIVFALSESPLARPVNIIGGHFISTLIGIAILKLAGAQVWSLALAVGLAIFFMSLGNIMHPPAGANPILVMLTGASWSYLLFPVLIGALLIVMIAYLYHYYRRANSSSKAPCHSNDLNSPSN